MGCFDRLSSGYGLIHISRDGHMQRITMRMSVTEYILRNLSDMIKYR